MMKKILCVFIASLLLLSCQQTIIEKPDNLIDENTMEDILYDLALLDAIKSDNPASLDKKNITAPTYIYQKYDIDSLQFASSNHYYASDIHNYLKMYQRVEERLGSEKTKMDTIIAHIAQKQKKLEVKRGKKAVDSTKSDSNKVEKKVEVKN